METGCSSEEEFHDRLAAVVNDAVDAGVEVEGSWPTRMEDGNAPNLDIEIVRLMNAD